MSDYKLAILAAGINREILPLKHKAVISHLIDKFPEDVEVVVVADDANGLLEEYLAIAHPERNFSYAEIEGAGDNNAAARSLLRAKEYLKCPFVLSAADAVVLEHVPRPTVNWLGVSPVSGMSRAASASIKDGFIADMRHDVKSDNAHAVIGLAGVNDYELFWLALEANLAPANGDAELSIGLNALIESPGKLCAVEFTWFDAGTAEGYEAARLTLEKSQEEFDASKTGDCAYFARDRVIKYFEDPKRAALFFRRAKALEGFVPQIDGKSEHFISYKRIPGRAMHEELDNARVLSLLSFLKNSFWEKAALSDSGKKEFLEKCRNFYEKNVSDSVAEYWNAAGRSDGPSAVNGNPIPPLADVLKKVDWEYISNGIPARFHGNLKLDNVLLTGNAKQPFMLLGWVADFAGLVDYGDLYHDLAALYGDMILPSHLVKKHLFSFKEKDGEVFFDAASSYSLASARTLYEKFLSDEGYDLRKVKILAALMFIRESSFQKEPLNFLLHHLGRLELSRCLDK